MRIPEGWRHQRLEEIAIVERGKFTPRPRNDPKYYGGDMPFVQTGDVTSAGVYLKNHTQTLNEHGIKVSKVFPANTILITIAANIGETAITSYEVACPDSVVGISPQIGKADVFWLKMMLETKKDELNGMATQNAQKNINLQVLRPLTFLTPSFSEQQKIAQILSTWDKAIENQEVLIAAKQKRKKALMQLQLTGNVRFPGFEGEWKAIHIGDLFQRVMRKNIEKHTNVVTISAQKGLIKQEEFFNKNVSSEILDHYFLMHKGEFAYNKSYSNGYPMGAIKRLNNYDKAVVTSLYICFAIKNESKSCGNFFEHYFESGRLINGLMKVANEGGRAHGLLNVTPEDFFALKCTIPDFIEQQKIAAFFSAIDNEITIHQNQLSALKQQKTGLMQQLLTGKKRVKVSEAE